MSNWVGDKHQDDFLIVAEKQAKEDIIISTQSPFVCNICYSVVASKSDESDYKNDKTGFLFFENQIYEVDIFLQKSDDGVVFTDIDKVDNISACTIKKYSDYANNNYNNITINWHDVIINYGVAYFRLKVKKTYLGNITYEYSKQYYLYEYNDNIVNDTFRIEALLLNKLGSYDFKDKIIDYSISGYYQQLRLCGYLSNETSEYVTETIEYMTGEQQAYKQEQVVSYILTIKEIDIDTLNYLKTNILQSDFIWITTYNNKYQTYIRERVLLNGAVEPTFNKYSNICSVEIKFKSAYNNLRKMLC